jgi:hypothetical protein
MALIGKKPSYMPSVDLAASPVPAPMSGALNQLPTMARPSFFGQGGVGRAIAGNIGDYLLQLSHMQPIYAPAREQQTAFERGEEQYQRRRKDNLSDQMTLLEYKDAHPDDQLTQYLNLAGITDPIQRANYYRQKAEAMTAPPMMSAQGVDEQGNPVMRFFPRAQPAPQTIPALPPGTVPLGGATPSASGTFPRR